MVDFQCGIHFSNSPKPLVIGTTHDVKVAPDLIDALDLKETKVLCVDKGYDSDLLRTKIEDTQTKANIPKKCNSKCKRPLNPIAIF